MSKNSRPLPAAPNAETPITTARLTRGASAIEFLVRLDLLTLDLSAPTRDSLNAPHLRTSERCLSQVAEAVERDTLAQAVVCFLVQDQIFAVKPGQPAVWSLRGARPEDRQFLFELNRATMREYVDATWGWDDGEQVAFFDEHFDPTRCQILQVGRIDIGVLAVEERAEEVYLAEIQVLPEWQGRGIGSSVIESLVEYGAASDKPVTLRVLRTNPRAATLYTRLGFEPFREIETHVYLRREPSQAGRRERPGFERHS